MPAELVQGHLIAVDWGTSNFRAALLDSHGNVLDRVSAARGIRQIPDGDFARAFHALLAPWRAACPHAPAIMAGMIGSVDGLRQTPYLACPTSLDAIADNLMPLTGLDGNRKIVIVPGLSSRSVAGNHDVLRGEEIQISGALTAAELTPRLLCLPGTHSKWVRATGRRVVQFSTCMTGDVFAAVRGHTILSRFTAGGEHRAAAFARGLAQAERSGGLLHHLFSARTEVLLGNLEAASAAAYLSGMLIGAEVKSMLDAYEKSEPVIVIGSSALTALYASALSHFGAATRCIDGDSAAIRGLWQLARHAGLA